MKKQFLYIKLLLVSLIVSTALTSQSQQTFTHVATRDNNSCNGDCTLLDIPELNDNAAAVILATPILEKGVNLNPHPIGVYYFKNKWSIFNLDQKAITPGAKFKVEYFAKPDPNNFQYTITTENVQKDGTAFLDHPSLNKNPNAKFRFFLSWNPEEQRGTTNREEANIQYNPDAGKWYVSNINKKPLFSRVVYNIALSSATILNTNNAVQINELLVTPTPNNNSVSGMIGYMYMTAWADGTKLPGDSLKNGDVNKTLIVDFEMGVSTLSATGQLSISGKRVYEPITIKKFAGFPASVHLFNAFLKNQDMVINIEAFTLSRTTGALELNYSIKLSGARIVGFKENQGKWPTPPSQAKGFQNSLSPDQIYVDEIKIIFTNIEFSKGGVFAVDNMKTGD